MDEAISIRDLLGAVACCPLLSASADVRSSDDVIAFEGQALQINLNYKKTKPTNVSATPIFRDITVQDVHVSSNGSVILCDGLEVRLNSVTPFLPRIHE